jgi:hypothetical protein
MTQTNDRRRHERFTVDPMYSAVAVSPLATSNRTSDGCGGGHVDGHVYEVSLGGIRFELDQPLPVGTRVSVEVTLPGCTKPICAEGRIVRVFDEIDDPGPRRMVVEFETFAAGARESLDRYLSQKWLRRAPTQQFVEAESEPTCEVMIETNAVAGKGSKKRSSASAA